MGLKGTLTKDNIGFSMPAHAPLFPRPSYYYEKATLMVFKYLTDPESAARMLPEQAELADIPEAPGLAAAGLVFADYPSSTLGAYSEVVQFLACVYQGKPIQFATHLYVTSDVAMAAGREMGGYPKKIANIRFPAGETNQFDASFERPTGITIARGSLGTLSAAVPLPAELSVLNYLTLRLVPSATIDAPPTVSELLKSDWEIVNGMVSEGVGTCELTGASEHDPLHYAPIVKIYESSLIRGDLKVTANPPDPSRNQPF